MATVNQAGSYRVGQSIDGTAADLRGIRTATARRSSRPLLLALWLVPVMFVARETRAESITVTSNLDNMNVDNLCTLREAILASNNNVPFNGCTAGSQSEDDFIILSFPVTMTFPDSVRVEKRNRVMIIGDTFPEQTTITGRQAGFIVAPDSELFIYNIKLSQYTSPAVHVQGAQSPSRFLRGVFHMDFSEISDGDAATGVQTSGIFCTGGVVNIFDSVIQRNRGLKGGAVENQKGRVTISRSTLVQNSVTQYGGAIHNTDTGLTILDNVTLSGNQQRDNFAGAGGGAIFNASQSTVQIDFSTITGNSATQRGDGIRNEGKMTIKRSIVSGNTDGGDDCFSPTSPNITSGGYNMVFGCEALRPRMPTDIDPFNPQIGVLTGDDGLGGQRFHEPGNSSPALNKIPASQCNGMLDQRANFRPSNGGCEIGAIETF